jgi:PrtD family type I secretion system ABC transporter
MSAKARTFVRQAAGALAPIVPTVVLISGVVNLLALTGSFYMLQIYDRVLTSRSLPSLLALSILALVLYLFQGVLDVIRAQVMQRLASRVDRRLSAQAHDALMQLRRFAGAAPASGQPLRDAEAVRNYLSGPGPIALVDLPWMPLYVGFVFILHPMLGWVTLMGTLVLIVVALATEGLLRGPSDAMSRATRQRWQLAEASERNYEALNAMGFAHRFKSRFAEASEHQIKANERLGDIVSGSGAVSRVLRLMLQSALLGLGAYLVIAGEMSAGAIIACSIAAARALAPVEQAIGSWRGLTAARQSAARLEAVLGNLPPPNSPISLPAPTRSLRVEAVTVQVPGTAVTALNAVTLDVKAGSVLAVIGPSAAGKSTLARVLTGVWPLARGAVRLDDAALASYPNEERGAHIGYLPQDMQLFDGSITENIARFEERPDSKKVLEAAQAAGVHELVLRLSEGYETRIGEGGCQLSAGQRQRIALARALYGDPFLVVLDEPNSNLDADGEIALVNAIAGVKARGGIVVVVAHRPSVLTTADQVAVISGGQLTAFGPRDEVLRKVLRQPLQVPAAIAVSAEARG